MTRCQDLFGLPRHSSYPWLMGVQTQITAFKVDMQEVLTD
jgi:hypothetical protein